MSIKADATLVNAAYRMGMANVPVDTSGIFKQQYEALAGIHTAKGQMVESAIKGIGGVLEQAVTTAFEIKDAKDSREWWKRRGDLSMNYLSDSALSWDDHFESKQKVDSDTKEHSQKELEAIKTEIEWLENNARGTEQFKELSLLKEKVGKWRQENNDILAQHKYHNTLWKNNQVDKTNSFKIQNPKTGKWEFQEGLANLYHQVMAPSISLSEANIERMRHPKTGQIGFAFNPNDDRLAQMYALEKRKETIDVDPRQIMTSKEIDKMGKRTAWISQEELLNMVKPKDNWSPTAVTSDMTNVLQTVNQMKDTYTRDPKTGALKTVKNGEFMHATYDGVRKKAEEQFYNTLMSPTQDDGNKGQQSRDARQSITYLSNNKWFLGNTEIDYNEHSKLNPAIATASYASLGLTGSVDADGNNILEGDELTDDDKTAIHNRLMNPQNQVETEVAAREMARYLNLQTEIKFLKDRGIIGVSAPAGGIVKKDTIPLWGQDVPKPTDSKMRRELALVGQIAEKNPTLIIDDKYKYKWNGKENKYVEVWTKIRGEKNYPEDPEKFTREQMIREYGGEIYGNIPVGYDFGDSKKDTADKDKDKTNVLKKGLGKGGGSFAKPPNVSQEKWDSLSELEQMGWYLKNE